MNLFDAVVLGIIQGLTEFLPVSSSGHLVLGQALLDVRYEGIAFEVFVHFGTLLSVVTIYRKDILSLLASLTDAVKNAGNYRSIYQEDENIRFITYIVIATLPAGSIGYFFSGPIESAFDNEKTVAFLLIITGVILLMTRFIKTPTREMTIMHAILIGFAQAIAILPGISRSGSTISIALYLGITRENAARFSFLLAIPVILGATVLKLIELVNDVPPVSHLSALLLGTAVAFVSGYAAIKLLLVFVRKGRLDYFAWYCFTAGILGVIYY